MAKIVLTGRPGVGKTTVVKKVAGKLEKIAGFYTEEIRESGTRVGFKVISFRGKVSILAHIDIKSQFKVGKYGVDIEAFEKVSIPEFSREGLFIVDEIGKMECFSQKFVRKVEELFASERNILATLGKGVSFDTKDAKVIEVTLKNRDKLPEDILEMLRY